MLAFLSKGGVLVIPIGLCSVVALAVFLERQIFFGGSEEEAVGCKRIFCASPVKRNCQKPWPWPLPAEALWGDSFPN